MSAPFAGLSPSERWFQLEEFISDENFPLTEGIDAPSEAACARLIREGIAIAKQPDAPKGLLGLFMEIESTVNVHALDVSKTQYDIGYGDGWNAGALAVVRMMASNTGSVVPDGSKALQFLLGMPYESKPAQRKKEGRNRA